MNLSQNRLALDIGVPARRINEIVLGKRSVSCVSARSFSFSWLKSYSGVHGMCSYHAAHATLRDLR
jgi:hypothetical protein